MTLIMELNWYSDKQSDLSEVVKTEVHTNNTSQPASYKVLPAVELNARLGYRLLNCLRHGELLLNSSIEVELQLQSPESQLTPGALIVIGAYSKQT
jgi:hypothetical protein